MGVFSEIGRKLDRYSLKAMSDRAVAKEEARRKAAEIAYLAAQVPTEPFTPERLDGGVFDAKKANLNSPSLSEQDIARLCADNAAPALQRHAEARYSSAFRVSGAGALEVALFYGQLHPVRDAESGRPLDQSVAGQKTTFDALEEGYFR